jgi:hypothetical protein
MGPYEKCVSIYQLASRHVLKHLKLHRHGCGKLTYPVFSLHLSVITKPLRNLRTAVYYYYYYDTRIYKYFVSEVHNNKLQCSSLQSKTLNIKKKLTRHKTSRYCVKYGRKQPVNAAA